MVSQFFFPPVKGLSGSVPHGAPHLNVTATGTKELSMSSKGAASGDILATRPLPAPRPMAPARVSPAWRSEPHWYNDPCNYLG